MTTKQFTNADSLVEYCIQNNILTGQIWVDSNPHGEGQRTLLSFSIGSSENIDTYLDGNLKDYQFSAYWHALYKGKFELVLPQEVNKKGFNPDTLEFNGVKIKERDKVEVRGYDGKYPVAINEDTGDLVVVFERVFVLLESLNITKHYPATPKDEELERLKSEVERTSTNALKLIADFQEKIAQGKPATLNDWEFKPYQNAIKNLENYKSKKNIE